MHSIIIMKTMYLSSLFSLPGAALPWDASSFGDILSASLLVYFAAAALAGLVAGLLGGGVGLILIPTLVYILRGEGLPDHCIMHVAIAVCVAAISIMGTVGSWSHGRQKTVDWGVFRSMVPGLLAGIVAGSLLAGALSSNHLILVFGVFVLLLAAYTWFGRDPSEKAGQLGPSIYHGMSLVIGFVGAVFGVSPIAVPFFKRAGMEMKNAVGTGLVLGTFMAYGIVVMYIITGWSVKGLPAFSTGYVDWGLVIPIAVASSIFAPLGAKLAFRISKTLLKVLYGTLLVIVGGKMILTAIVGAQGRCFFGSKSVCIEYFGKCLAKLV